MNKAVFFDRDGVVNKIVYHHEMGVIDTPFTPDQFELLPGIADAVKAVKQAGYLAIVITNQPGVAKGKYDIKTMKAIQDRMEALLAEEGAAFDAVYACLHHPDAVVPEYKLICECRKPKPGLLLKAAEEHDIDLKESAMVGDSLTDIDAGKRAGCGLTVLLGKRKCDICKIMDEQGLRPDHIVENITDIEGILQGQTTNNTN